MAAAGEPCTAIADGLRAVAVRVLLARTPFEAVVKATYHEPTVILLDPSLGLAATDETRTLLAQCPMTAAVPVELLPGSRVLPGHVLAALAA